MHPAQVGVAEVEPGARPPVAEQAGLDVLGDERTAQQGVVHEVDLARGQVVGGPEVGVELAQRVILGRSGVDVHCRCQSSALLSAHAWWTCPSSRRRCWSCAIWQGGWVNILVVNAGSSSLKLRLLDDADDVIAAEDLPRPGVQRTWAMPSAPSSTSTRKSTPSATGWSTVAPMFTQPVLLDDRARRRPRGAGRSGPPAQPASRWPPSMRCDRFARICPRLPASTRAFHADMPAKAATYAVPRTWREQWGIRRFGFHGLSHAWASRRAGELLGRPQRELRLVTAHLGAGASLAAVAFGRSVDTTMGFTPMEGLVMATRSGSVDPGLLLWVQRHGGLSADDVEDGPRARIGTAWACRVGPGTSAR